jgi:hypothetical protein
MKHSSRLSDAFLLGCLAVIVLLMNTSDPGSNVFLAVMLLPSAFVFCSLMAETFLGKE